MKSTEALAEKFVVKDTEVSLPQDQPSPESSGHRFELAKIV
jgi:hypothetical protein